MPLDFINISILGTGWLGLPLAKLLLEEGCSVRGSTTSRDKIELLKETGIDPYLLKITSIGVEGDITGFLKNAEVLIIDFPPGLRKDPGLDYSGAIEKLSEAIQASGVKKVIFVSSISVYEETENIPVYTEETAPNAIFRGGKEIIAAEKVLLENPIFDTTVIRFGGLIGAGRHPVKYLAGRSGLANPLGPVNLIHLEDCLDVIKKLLENSIFGVVYNAVYPLNPSREEYYTEKAREAGLAIPEFDRSKPSVGKVISSLKLVHELGVDFKKGI